MANPSRFDLDLSKKSNAELVELQLARNDWYVRHARRLLQERAAAGKDMADVHKSLRKMFADNPDETRKLRALWALHVTNGLNEEKLLTLLGHADEHVRSWSIRFLCEDRKPSEPPASPGRAAKEDTSPLVRLFIASMLQRVPVDQRWDTLVALAGHEEDASDQNLPLMNWYAAEPVIRNNAPPRRSPVAGVAKCRCYGNSLSARWVGFPRSCRSWPAAKIRRYSLTFLKDERYPAGVSRTRAPPGWTDVAGRLSRARFLKFAAMSFGSRCFSATPGRSGTRAPCWPIPDTDIEARKVALQTLVTVRDSDAYPVVVSLLHESDLASLAVRGLGLSTIPAPPDSSSMPIQSSIKPLGRMRC